MENEVNKLYLIDGMSIVFRAYHAMSTSGLKSPNGEPTGAVFGFTNIITSLLERFNPQRIAVVFDRPEPTFRHKMYPEYKANRDEFPQELVPQLLRIKELLDLLNIPRIELSGYEADDIIGTLAKQASKNNWQVKCLTSDKDYYQLVDENISLMKPGKRGEDFEIINIPQVIEKFGVQPNQVIEVLALIGDSSDNIPGIKGVGEKTAIPLIQKYGNIENIYKNLNKIEKQSLKSKFEDSKDIAELSKVLVTIDVNVPLNYNIDDCKIKTPKYHEIDNFFAELGFNSIREKWRIKAKKNNFSNEITTNDSQNNDKNSINKNEINEKKVNYILIKNLNELDNIIDEIQNEQIFSFDLETDSLDRDSCEIVGISLSCKENTAYYIPVEYYNTDNINSDFSLFNIEDNQSNPKWKESLNIYDVLEKIKFIFANENIQKCGQNIKFDTYILERHGVRVSPLTFDSMIASYIIDPDQKHNLDFLANKYLNYNTIPITKLIGEKKSQQISMRNISPEEIKNYACEDSDIALKLMNALKPILTNEKLEKIAYDIEFPLIEVLVNMELAGISIDTNSLNDISIIIKEEISNLKSLIYKESGVEFNIDSPKQLAEILFSKMQIPVIKKNKTGFSTDVQVLSELQISYPIAGYILEYRQATKLLSTYVESLPKLINPKTNRIHTTYNQAVASTGRLSSTEPNLQNIPIRTDLGKEIRKAFVAKSDDYLIFAADYSQIELRIMAYISNDSSLINAFKNGLDVHSSTAAILNGIDISEVNQDMRRVAKTVNFGIMYGLGSYGLSQRLGIPRKSAKEIIENYFKKYPGISSYMENTIKSTKEKTYAETLLGRRRYFIDINEKNANLRAAAERAAINMPIQGTASDMLKLAMIKINRFIKSNNLKSKMLLQVHDELVFEAHKDELEFLRENVVNIMINALPLGEVPIVVETGIGTNWFEAH